MTRLTKTESIRKHRARYRKAATRHFSKAREMRLLGKKATTPKPGTRYLVGGYPLRHRFERAATLYVRAGEARGAMAKLSYFRMDDGEYEYLQRLAAHYEKAARQAERRARWGR